MVQKKKLFGYMITICLTLIGVMVTGLLLNGLAAGARAVAVTMPAVDSNDTFLSVLLLKLFLIVLCALFLLPLSRRKTGFCARCTEAQSPFFQNSQLRIGQVIGFYAVLMLMIEIAGAYIARGNGAAIAVPKEAGSFLGFLIAVAGVNPIAEELFFRVLMTVWIVRLLKMFFPNRRQLFILTWMATTLIFVSAHITISVAPLAVTHFNVPQLLSVALQGSVYYWLYIKYKSIIPAIVAHSIADALYCFAGLLFV